MKKLKRFAAATLSVFMLATTCLAADMPMGPMGPMGPDGSMGPMGPGGPMGPMGPMGPGMGATVTESGAQSIEDFLDFDSIQNQDEVSLLVSLDIINGIKSDGGSHNDNGASGVLISSDNFAASGIALSGGTGKYTLGGSEDFFSAEDIAAVSETAKEYVNRYAADEGFNSAIILGAETSSNDLASAGNAITTDGGELHIVNSYLQTSGAIGRSPSGRYAAACIGTGTIMVVNDSYIIHAGATELTKDIQTPPSNAGLLIGGRGRANFSIGETDTYYYNSTVIAEGWASMSTDSATGEGLDFVAYNSTAIAENTGYGIYSDTNCRDYLYAVTMKSAEIGAILSNNGYVYIGSGADATEDHLKYNLGATSDAPSTILAGRNNFQLHSPDMMGQGTAGYQAQIVVENSELITTTDLKSTEDYYAVYDEAVGRYIDYVKGANILVKSTGADITLNNVTAQSYSDTLLLTALNSDSMSRYLKSEGYDVEFKVEKSTLSGDIRHDDYQRDVYITLTDTDYTGAISYSTYEEWNAMWADVADCANNYWSNLDGTTYLTETHDTGLTLKNSTWNVSGNSKLTGITLDATSKVIVGKDATLTVGDKVFRAGTYTASDFANLPQAGTAQAPELTGGDMGGMPGGMPGMPGGMPGMPGDMGGMPGGMPGMPGDMGGMPGGPDGGGAMSGAMASDMPSTALIYYSNGTYDASKVSTNGTIKVAEGGDYCFDPEGTLTRAQMATIIARALNVISDEELVGETIFSDTYNNWAKDYIAYCADKGIFQGDGTGKFNPNDQASGHEFAASLLRTMGKEIPSNNWKSATEDIAKEIGLLEGLNIDLSLPMSRDNAAKIVANALLLSDGSSTLPQILLCKETKELSSFIVGENTLVTAPEGQDVVLTVNGATETLDPGTYNGKIVLSVVDLISDNYVSHGSSTVQTMTAALCVDDNGVRLNESVTAALVGGRYDSKKAEGITITSNSDSFGGIRVGGSAEYVIENCTFILTGNGGNDFTGIGCAVSAVDNAKIVIKNCVIKTEGALRGAFFVGDNADIEVIDCEIHTKSLWANEEETELQPVTISTAGMTTPPTGLGVYGNCRSNNVVDFGEATYTNCKIYADSWGAMGTDDVDATEAEPTYMNLNNCYIEVAGSGYGAYAIGHIWDVLDGTHVVVDNGMGVIVAAEGSTKLMGESIIDSNRFGIVTHQGMGAVSNIVITEESTINAKYTGIQIKDRATNITISDGATINVTNGALIHALVNDDTGAGALQGSEVITISIQDTKLKGDIINSLPKVPMNITMENADLKGAISSASYTYLNGGVVNDPHEVGIVTSYTTEAVENVALSLTLAGSTWDVAGTSYLTGLTFDAASTIHGTITVNGKVVTAPGAYTGTIVVTE